MTSRDMCEQAICRSDRDALSSPSARCVILGKLSSDFALAQEDLTILLRQHKPVPAKTGNDYACSILSDWTTGPVMSSTIPDGPGVQLPLVPGETDASIAASRRISTPVVAGVALIAVFGLIAAFGQ